MLGPFVDRDGIDVLARDQIGQPAAARVVAAMLERGRGENRGGEEGRRGKVRADLLQHDVRLDLAHAEPAVVFGQQDAGEAHFAELLPQAMAEAVLAVAVAPVAQLLGNAAFFADEIARAVGQHRLIVVVIKWHLLLPLPFRGEGRGVGTGPSRPLKFMIQGA